MGGGIAQELALTAPERVASLTLIATTAVDPRVGELPGVTPELAALFADGAPEPDRSDPTAAVEALVEGERPFAGPDAFDEARVRAIARRVVARSRDLAAGAATTPRPRRPPGPTTCPRSPGSRRWSCTAPPTRCSRSSTAGRSRRRSRGRGCSRSRAWATSCRPPRRGTSSSTRSAAQAA